jgi:hypothetical protein
VRCGVAPSCTAVYGRGSYCQPKTVFLRRCDTKIMPTPTLSASLAWRRQRLDMSLQQLLRRSTRSHIAARRGLGSSNPKPLRELLSRQKEPLTPLDKPSWAPLKRARRGKSKSGRRQRQTRPRTSTGVQGAHISKCQTENSWAGNLGGGPECTVPVLWRWPSAEGKAYR